MKSVFFIEGFNGFEYLKIRSDTGTAYFWHKFGIVWSHSPGLIDFIETRLQ